MYSAQNRMDSFTFREALTVTQCALVLHSIWRILGGARTARGFLCALHSGRAVLGCFRSRASSSSRLCPHHISTSLSPSTVKTTAGYILSLYTHQLFFIS